MSVVKSRKVKTIFKFNIYKFIRHRDFSVNVRLNHFMVAVQKIFLDFSHAISAADNNVLQFW